MKKKEDRYSPTGVRGFYAIGACLSFSEALISCKSQFRLNLAKIFNHFATRLLSCKRSFS